MACQIHSNQILKCNAGNGNVCCAEAVDFSKKLGQVFIRPSYYAGKESNNKSHCVLRLQVHTPFLYHMIRALEIIID